MDMEGDRVKVGIVASLSGRFSSQGSQALHGARIWARDTNEDGGIFVGTYGGKLPAQLTHYDDGSQAQAARAMTERLITHDRVDLLLGPYSSVLTLASAPVAESFQRVLWNHGGASDRIYNQGFRWVVGILTPASQYLHGVIDLVKEWDPSAQRVAILHSDKGSFSSAVASGVESYGVEQGLSIVLKGRFRPPMADFSELLDEVERREPDVILGVGTIEDDLLLARQMVRRRVKTKAIALVAAGIGQFKEALGSSANGFLGPSQWEPTAHYSTDYGPQAQDLATRFAPYGPGGGDYAMAQAYATGLVARKCVEEAGTLDNRALRDMADKIDFTTFYGRFKLDPLTPGRQVGHSVVLVQWQGGRKVVVWPRELRQADPLYPFVSFR